MGIGGYFLWQITPGARFRRAFADAEKALAEYDFAEARGQLARCLEIRPNDPTARLRAAQAARRDGDIAAAADHLLVFHNLIGETTEEERLEWAMLDAQRGKIDEVGSYLMECLEIRHPASERIFEALAIGCVHNYQFERLRFWVEETLERFPKNAVARLIRAQTMETLGHREMAIEMLEELLREFPRYGHARLEIANLLQGSLRYDEAAEHYELLRRRAPEQMLPLLGLARCRLRQGRTDEARPLLQELQERHANNSEVLLECGRFALQEARFPDAESLLRRAVDLAPFDHEVHLQLSTCLHQLGRSDEARIHSDKAKQIESDLIRLEKVVQATVNDPQNLDARVEAGEICLRNGQEAEALRWLHGTLERDPDHKGAHAAMAKFYALHNDLQQAQYHQKRAR
jgi:tetratricopeptide (TPR) repeat protein